ncbi:MAG: cupin domain-containing protein, partial [Calditrichia bacterium]
LLSVQLVHAQASAAADPHLNTANDEAFDVSQQDPTVVDSKHYKVVFENDQVRVVRITYGPGEKSVMHYHPDGVAVFMTDNKVKFTKPDGKTFEIAGEAGQVIWDPAGKHLPQNMGDKPMEVILVEMKNNNKAE